MQEKGTGYYDYFDVEDEIVTQGEFEYQFDYTYTQKSDSLIEEIVYSYLAGEEWIYRDKELNVYNANEIQIGMYMYDYEQETQEWVLDYMNVATEFDEKGNPVIVVDSTVIEGVLEKTAYMTASYNGLGQISGIIIYSEGEEGDASASEEEWGPIQKIDLVYNEDGKRIEDVYSDYEGDTEDWIYSSTVEYGYDEKGNVNSEIERDDHGIIEEIYYTNVYSPDTSNDMIVSVQSAIYPNPVSDVLNVVVEGADNAVLTLVNAAGSVMVQQKVTQSEISIPVQSFGKGYYFLTIQTNKGVKTHKVIVR